MRSNTETPSGSASRASTRQRLACRFPLDEMVHVELCSRLASEFGGGVEVHHDPEELVAPVGVSYGNALFPPTIDGERVTPWLRAIAITDEGGDPELVGFVMYNDSPLDDGTYRLSRVMIDRRYQGRGYGRVAAELVLARMRDIEGCEEVLLDYVAHNEVAAHLWTSMGFVPCGYAGENVLAKYTFSSDP